MFGGYSSNTVATPQFHSTLKESVPYVWFIGWWTRRTRRQRRSHGSIWVCILHGSACTKRRRVRRMCVRRRYAAKYTQSKVRERTMRILGLDAG
jgi:hypothetical protein